MSVVFFPSGELANKDAAVKAIRFLLRCVRVYCWTGTVITRYFQRTKCSCKSFAECYAQRCYLEFSALREGFVAGSMRNTAATVRGTVLALIRAAIEKAHGEVKRLRGDDAVDACNH